MAARLPVIMIQTPPASLASQHLGESIIGELIGRPGIDLVLIGRLSDLREGATDRLTLESMAGDAAVLDWQSPQAIVAALAELGFHGERAPHADDPSPAPVTPLVRRIYAFDLNRFDRAEALCDALMKLLASRQVRTFGLGSVAEGSTSAANGRPRKVGPGQDAEGKMVTPPQKPPSYRPKDPPLPANPLPANPAVSSSRERKAPASDGDLDALLDELDQLDP